MANTITVREFLEGKPAQSLRLFDHFIKSYGEIAPVTLYPAKSMIGVAHSNKRIAWVTQFGKSFIHIVFPFTKPYPDNLCFVKIAQVPGQQQFNHHFRMCLPDDINDEVIHFMKLAYDQAED